ncbi:hypothetical protein ABW19_dt0203540 [Dactylella cylindrospora]|nr:hypothetical protein ABW19_dt0203540 [Dactylella cylindrospora]
MRGSMKAFNQGQSLAIIAVSLITHGLALPAESTGSGSALPQSAAPGTLKFVGKECQLGLWDEWGSKEKGSWEGLPLRGPKPNACIDVSKLKGIGDDTISAYQVQGHCMCEFFKDNDCKDFIFDAYSRGDYSLGDPSRGEGRDNSISSFKCKPHKEFGPTFSPKVTICSDPNIGGDEYDPKVCEEYISPELSTGKCFDLGEKNPAVVGKLRSASAQKARCRFYPTKSCNGKPIIQFGADPWDHYQAAPEYGDRVKSFNCEPPIPLKKESPFDRLLNHAGLILDPIQYY